MGSSQQQQQSNMLEPQSVSAPKKGMIKMKRKKGKSKKTASFEQVEKSVQKSKGY